MSSGLELYSLGYVVKDYVEDNPMIEVYPIEMMPTNTGEITDTTPTAINNTNIDGQAASVVVDESKKITAKWLPLHNYNRVTSPCVCKGETVMLFNFHGTDTYYWSTMASEVDLRKKEKVTYLFSNKDGIGTADLPNKSYYITFDTINKFVHLHTSNNDGELTTYDFTIDTKNGALAIEDGKGNSVILTSDNDTLTLTTNNAVIINATKDVTVNTTNATVNASSSIALNGNAVSVKASTFTVSSGITKIN